MKALLCKCCITTKSITTITTKSEEVQLSQQIDEEICERFLEVENRELCIDEPRESSLKKEKAGELQKMGDMQLTLLNIGLS